MVQFIKAEKRQAKLRLALIGPSGSGKTYSALAIAEGLGGKVALVDTEHGSASLYADRFQFDVLNLESFHPERYVEAIAAAQDAGYDVLIVDSLSHAWSGKDGALEQVDKAAARDPRGNSFAAWRHVTPQHNKLVEAMLRSKMHLIVTMRTKTEYVIEKDERTGKNAPKKIGLAPVQRDGLEYEFTIVGDVDLHHNMVITKTRCSELTDAVIEKPGKALGKQLVEWLETGEAPLASENEPSFEQLELRDKLMRSQVITADEKTKLRQALIAENTKDKATIQIDWLLKTIKVRKDAEKKAGKDQDEPEVEEALAGAV